MITFTKVSLPYGWLGNMSAFPIEYDGKTWRTSEALFQSLRFDDDLIKEIIRNEKSPMGAKMKSKKYKDQMVIEPMSDRDVENMKLCLRLKLEYHPQLREELNKTGNQIIVEDIGNRKGERHLFWGARIIDGKIVGKNILGNIWMELRNDSKYY